MPASSTPPTPSPPSAPHSPPPPIPPPQHPTPPPPNTSATSPTSSPTATAASSSKPRTQQPPHPAIVPLHEVSPALPRSRAAPRRFSPADRRRQHLRSAEELHHPHHHLRRLGLAHREPHRRRPGPVRLRQPNRSHGQARSPHHHAQPRHGVAPGPSSFLGRDAARQGRRLRSLHQIGRASCRQTG